MIEFDETIDGYRIVGLMTKGGHRCGYIAVPKGHPLHGIEYNHKLPTEQTKVLWEHRQVDDKTPVVALFCHNPKEGISLELVIEVHGGLTYSGASGKYPVESDGSLWWFGFDCDHYRDAIDMEYLREHNPSIYEIEMRYGLFREGVLRSKEYVYAECVGMVKQFKQLTEILSR